MKFNDFTYHLITISQESMRLSKGFKGGVYSTDGNWIMGTKHDNEDCSDWIVLPETLPDYMVALGVVSCGFTHEKMLELIRFQASAKGASDGFSFREIA